MLYVVKDVKYTYYFILNFYNFNEIEYNNDNINEALMVLMSVPL